MKILFLSQRVPYPPNRGDKITTWRLVQRFARHHEVVTIAFAHDEADMQAADELNRMGYRTLAFRHRETWKKAISLPLLLTKRPLTLGVFSSKEMQRAVDKEIVDANLVYAYSSSMGAFMLPHPEVPKVMHFAELDSDKWRQYAERENFPSSWIYRREWKTLHEFEKRLAHACADNVLCTPLEQRIFQEAIPDVPTSVLRNGVDLEFFHPEPELAEPGHLVFTGVMNYLPNVDGCLHFAQEILPRVREKFPETRFTIIGSKPTPEIEKLAETPGITVTGFVDDIRDTAWKGAISVAPLRIARGIQNKVLEALALAQPVVGTTCATQGVGGEPGKHFLLANSVDEQVEALCSLLADPERARALGRAGRAFVEAEYDWEAVLGRLDEIVDSCAKCT